MIVGVKYFEVLYGQKTLVNINVKVNGYEHEECDHKITIPVGEKNVIVESQSRRVCKRNKECKRIR